MSYIGIRVRLVEQVTILDADRQGRICLRFGARTVTLANAVRSLLDQGQNQILLNLANVDRIEAEDLRELVSISVAVKKRGGQMKLIPLTPRLAELMTNRKERPLFEAYQSESQAIDSFRNQSSDQANSLANTGT